MEYTQQVKPPSKAIMLIFYTFPAQVAGVQAETRHEADLILRVPQDELAVGRQDPGAAACGWRRLAFGESAD